MKKFFVICALSALLLLSVSCGDGKKNEPANDSDTTDTDSENVAADSDKSGDADPADITEDPADDHDTTDPRTDSETDDGIEHNDSDTNNDYPVVEVSCEDNGTQGILTECVDDAPCETTECPDGNSCNRLYTDCGECRNGTSKCYDGDSGTGIYICETGSFKLLRECTIGCNSDGRDCAGDECTDGETKCVNGDDDRGETYSCTEGRWQKDEVKCAGSCDKQMKQCGEGNCVNYTMKCRDDLTTENGGGAIAQCKFGKWEIYEECSNGFSCKNENSCGECRNGSTKCEDRDVDGIMNKNCNAKGECETDSNGNTKWYPANIGVQLLCSSGEWIDDIYCPAVAGTFQQYQSMNYLKWTTEMTWVYKVYNGVLVHDDYHYSSCNNTAYISECGTCNNHFNICSDEKISDRPQGHIYKCQNGQIVSSLICSNKTCSSNHTQCN